jgi:hypothetical protein
VHKQEDDRKKEIILNKNKNTKQPIDLAGSCLMLVLQ